jgi:hypothetical protein
MLSRYKTAYTDAGSGGDKPSNQYTIKSPTGSSATKKTTTVTTPKKITTSSTTKTSTPAAPATQTPTTLNSSGGGGGYSGGGDSGGGGEEITYNYNNWNDYLKMANSLISNQYNAEKDSANSYKNTANNNLNRSEAQYNSTYNTNKALLDQLAAQNAARENTINNAINQGYADLINNAQDYYNNLLGTYNRSMGFVNQGYEEGKSTSEQARDEAIRLAQSLYDMGEQTQNKQTEKGLRNQYISYLRGMRNIDQQLAAQGINGGASETALLNALNGYEGNRTDLYEANLAALGMLRQQQMQSDSEAQQAYLNNLANLIAQRTQNQLNVENTRASGESNFANMKGDAINTKSNQTLQAQQAFQNWASDLTSQRTTNENTYANAIAQLMNDRNSVLQNYQNMYSNALNNRTSNSMSGAYADAIDKLSMGGKKANINKKTSNKTTKEKKAAKKAAPKRQPQRSQPKRKSSIS